MKENIQNSMRYFMLITIILLSLLICLNSYSSVFNYEVRPSVASSTQEQGKKNLMILVYLSHKVGCLSLFKYMVDEKILTKDLQTINTKVQKYCEEASQEAAREMTR